MHDRADVVRTVVRAFRGDPAWDYHEADASHDVMGDQPEHVLALLLDCA